MLAVVAILATLWSVYYARKQLNEAKQIREQNQAFLERQQTEDNLWSDKYVRAAQILCVAAPRFIQGGGNKPGGDALHLLFPDFNIRNQVLSLLIDKKSGLVYMIRPLDVTQLRLKPLRDLIETVLNRFEEFKNEDQDFAKRMGLPSEQL
jgi:hypothetical protein